MPPIASNPRAIIVGAGLAGSLLACVLARQGFRVDIYERRPDPRLKGYAGGRSINLALSARGLHALAQVGLDKVVLEADALPMRGRMIHPLAAPGVAGPLTFQPYSSNLRDAINSVSRAGLNITLLNAAQRESGVTFHFDHPCTDIDLDAPAVHLTSPAGQALIERADLVLGADGAFSPVRLKMMKSERFNYSQHYEAHAYKELHIPPTSSGEFALDPTALHIWPGRARGASMMIALPNRDRSFTATLFWPLDGDHGLRSLTTRDAISEHFVQHYPDAPRIMPALADDYAKNPNGSLVTIRCSPWTHEGKVALLGDAAHAIVPFYGQGMNAAFEDVIALAESLKAHPTDRRAALAHYQQERTPNAEAIADMALDNFVEMRDKTAHPEFHFKKRLEQTMHQLFPEHCQPQYNLVSFSTVPYTEAQARGRHLDRVLHIIMQRLSPGEAANLTPESWQARVRDLGEAALKSVGPLSQASGSGGGTGVPPGHSE